MANPLDQNRTIFTGSITDDGYLTTMQSHLIGRNNLNYKHQITTPPIEELKLDFDEFIAAETSAYRKVHLGWVDDVLVSIRDFGKSENSYIYFFADHDISDESVQKVKDWITEVEVDDDSVRVNFWALGGNGPRNWSRTIEVPSWNTIQNNYPPVVQTEIERLVDVDHKEADGRLILMHGLPGGGKTYTIRALLREWKDKITASYIVDPEKFFSRNPDYMLDVILGTNSGKCQLLILEDTGELLHANARERSGQGLSRLLNLVDGLIGQGLNLMTMLTTNEKVETFHEAVVRPGRCLAKIHFDQFSEAGARQWLREHGYNGQVNQPMTLADMYALLEDRLRNQEEEIQIGQYV